MAITTIEIPTKGCVLDRYEIEDTCEGVTIEHSMIDADGGALLRSVATLMIMPEAVADVIRELQRARGRMEG